VKNPDIEESTRVAAIGWDKYNEGYEVDNHRESSRGFNQGKKKYSSILLQADNFSVSTGYGASQDIQVGQTIATPLMITGWARSSRLVNSPEALPKDTSIYMHMTFEDGTRELEVSLDISESPTWRFYSDIYYPPKPVKEMSLSVILSRTKGKIWFDDIQVFSLDSNGLCSSSFVARSTTHLFLPDTIIQYEGDRFVGTPNPLSCHAKGPRFILIWTTEENTFTLRDFRVIESIFFHHPNACVRVFSNTLDSLYFYELAFYGYDIHVMEYDLAQIAEKMPGEDWMKNIDKWKEGPHFYAHSSDYLRFLLLYKYGGIYSDFDSILLQPLPLNVLSDDFIGVEWCEIEGLVWCISLKESDFAFPQQIPHETPPTTTFTFSIGLMGFSVGNPFVADILKKFETDYTPTRWGCGTVLASMAYKESSATTTPQVRIVPTHAFYPLGYQHIPKYFSKFDQKLWDELLQHSYAIHLFGKLTREEKLQVGSLAHKALSEFALTNGEFT
jgi:hypothetical protein